MRAPLRKRGQLDDLSGLVTTLGAFAILIAVIFMIVAQTKTQVGDIGGCSVDGHFWNATDSMCYNSSNGTLSSNSAAWNATSSVQSATADIPGWLPIVVITVIGVILLGLVRLFRKN